VLPIVWAAIEIVLSLLALVIASVIVIEHALGCEGQGAWGAMALRDLEGVRGGAF